MKVADKLFLDITSCPIEEITRPQIGDIIIKLHWDYDSTYWKFQIVKVKELDMEGNIHKSISTPVIQLSRLAKDGERIDFTKRASFLTDNKFYQLVKEFDDADTI